LRSARSTASSICRMKASIRALVAREASPAALVRRAAASRTESNWSSV
jgi:hypothetical protein